MSTETDAIDAALEAFKEEALRWVHLPNHGGGRGFRSERRDAIVPHSFVNGAAPMEKPNPISFDSQHEREQHTQRACMRRAIEAYQRVLMATPPVDLLEKDAAEPTKPTAIS